MTDQHWYDDEAGPMIRPFTLTRGRTRPSVEATYDVLAQVSAVPDVEPDTALDHARRALLDRVRRGPRPVAELAADADLPLGTVRVLLGDLVRDGLVRITEPDTHRGRPDVRVLESVIQGLRRL